MSLETEQKLIDELHKCVNAHPHRDELIALMDAQLADELCNCAIVHDHT